MKQHGCLISLLVALGIVALFLLRVRTVPAHPWFGQFDANQYPLVIAHADDTGSGLWPGNTMPFLEGSAALGVDVLEMDIHMTSDGQIVLMHDDLLDRTTNGTGLVSDHTLAEIKALEVADNWTQDGGATYPYQGQGLQVPTVAEAFERFPDTPMIIEIKQDSPDLTGPFCDLIRQYDMAEKVLVPSFDDDTIKVFRAACPEVATASASDETRAFVIASFLQAINALQPAYQALQVPESSGNIPVVIAPFVNNAHKNNLQVHIWTINDPAEYGTLHPDGSGRHYDRPA